MKSLLHAHPSRLMPALLLRAVMLTLLFSAPAMADGEDECQETTPAVSSMRVADLVFTTEDGEVRFQGRLAETSQQRAAGMQYLCVDAIKDNPILFVFSRAIRPTFHMNNVLAPLDILFLDDRGMVNEIHRMEPGDGLTTPVRPARFALELLAGESERLGLTPGLTLQIHPQ